MKISSSKKQLAKIIHENGGWREEAESSAQCSDGSVSFWYDKATKDHGAEWCGSYLGARADIKFTGVRLPNWHQTLLSRKEYFHLYPVAEAAPDAEAEQKAEIRWVRGKDIYAPPTAHDCMEMLKEKWGSTECGCDECSAFYSKPTAHAESTIEQLAADYRNAKDYADRKQQEADDAKAAAETKLKKLVAAGKTLGLVLSVVGVEPELVITDWRDLRVGDVVWYGGDDELSPGEYHVMEIEAPGYEGYRTVLVNGGNGGHWIDTRVGWGFIRRPI